MKLWSDMLIEILWPDGETSGDSQPQSGYRPAEKVWYWGCDNSKCWREGRKITIPAGKIPDSCRNCGEDSFRKTGEGTRVK